MDFTAIGRWAFVIGVILAVIAGFTKIPAEVAILFILGLIVGYLNIKGRETTPFLVAVAVLLLIGLSYMEFTEILPLEASSILENFVAFVSAAGLIVALKEILVVAKPGEQITA